MEDVVTRTCASKVPANGLEAYITKLWAVGPAQARPSDLQASGYCCSGIPIETDLSPKGQNVNQEYNNPLGERLSTGVRQVSGDDGLGKV